MKVHLSTLLKRPFVRYLIVGGGVYMLELGVILIAQAGGASPVSAVAISFWSGIVISFLLQKFVTFQDKRMHHKIFLRQVLSVGLLVGWNFFFTIAVTWLLQARLPPTVTRTIALCITTLWNFYLYRTSIFREPENPIY